ncbi:MAG: 3-ketoacyl-(Acyl-carrier-protein) reductase [Candidatus Woesebacteria bacterium GW2011_GWA1_33_30]|uniref:3-ketoacyl-(Acyl-carrier-protein) reductase n=1 Tax=Candidatus Woesebacteria bacterium GW2011_GWA2_33_28 TaxID=1618561 RepID=A0A0G0CAV4_9BACT|nr:MAG: 3-ketoacyl-(Acyl-carrier-protein) reductase [Candidatus Woesebacteria bacterium GW2011_GWA2_33_28]KKP49082.1 MAG: 3-ketoacyl-(Acyl-carrier-protein) reductase [Candidatus Woesebacteria bacterium GW2011_GWA1_33_30]KKP50318.1 MAG: 3-ketoacyl-(Acyl-carrier-protein) reductase [Microgenomates group bacterium GW2011_GWC1_33_32]KKP52673.1 MAG: 3-ketoacyl-(Acyl-carrier-protein) reductase [Candidatus Woesebacteria bacterium GW2011_GWB1_33_38]KKP56294.1 MAG: 3-ketoacyl-(Acyl-carrier-protein) reduc
MNLKGKVVVVTGSSDGIGKQVALKLANEGVLLALVARDEDRLKEVKNKCLELGSSKVESYSCDVSDKDKVKETINKILVDFNTVDILLNIAGVWQELNKLEDISDEEIDSVININLKGVIYVTKQLLKYFKERDEEAIILNVSSRSGVTTQEGQSIYTASKWGVTGFTEVLKTDLKNSKIRVATLHQGGTNTNLFSKTGEHFNQDKFIKPEDLADVIVFMLSRPPQIWLHDVRVEY